MTTGLANLLLQLSALAEHAVSKNLKPLETALEIPMEKTGQGDRVYVPTGPNTLFLAR